MKLVVDANILFSFFKRDSTPRKLILDPELEFNLELLAPKYVLQELEKHKDEICSKFGISPRDFDIMFSSLPLFVRIAPKFLFEEFLDEAEKILSPHFKDVPYFALALKLNCGLWSNEKRLKRQSKVEVLSTTEVVKRLFNN